MRTPRSLLAVAGAGVLALTAACGTSTSLSSKPPKSELVAAMANLDASSAVQAVLHLSATAAQIQQLGRATGGGGPSASDAAMLAGANVTVVVRSTNGKSVSPCAQKSGSYQPDEALSVDLGGSPIIESRTVAGTVYVRADVQKALAIGHQPPQMLAQLQSRVPASVTFVHAALRGDWVSMRLDALTTLAQSGGASNLSTDPQKVCALSTRLRAVLTNDVTVTRVGSGSGGDHLVITGSTRTLATGVLSALQSVLPPLPQLAKLNPATIPDRTFHVDAYVTGSTLSRLAIDVTQFAPAAARARLGGQPVDVTVDLSTSAPAVSAPAGATPVDIGQLGALVGALSAKH